MGLKRLDKVQVKILRLKKERRSIEDKVGILNEKRKDIIRNGEGYASFW
jgi:hypothetical protein